jgi:hypothetical protein
MWLLLCWLIWMPVAEAKTLSVPKTGKNENRLHQELLTTFPAWGPVIRPDGTKEDPGLLRVESTDTEIRLTVPDEADERAIQSVIKSHMPKPKKPKQPPQPLADPASLSLEERVRQLEAVLGIE